MADLERDGVLRGHPLQERPPHASPPHQGVCHLSLIRLAGCGTQSPADSTWRSQSCLRKHAGLPCWVSVPLGPAVAVGRLLSQLCIEMPACPHNKVAAGPLYVLKAQHRPGGT